MINLYDLNNQWMKYHLHLPPMAPGEDARRGEPSKPVDEFLDIWPKSDSAKDKPQDDIKNRPWFIHKMVKQAIWRPLFAIGWVPRTFQMYRTYLARFSANPNEDIFRDPAARIFDRRTRTGRAFQRLLLPKKYRKLNLTSDERDILRTSGAKHIRFAAKIWTGANYLRIGGNLIGLYDNLWGQGGSASEAVVMATDTAISTSFIGVQKFYAYGAENIQGARKLIESVGNNSVSKASTVEAALARQQRAYRLFKIGKIISYSAFTLQSIGAGIKLYNEFQKGSNARLSVIVDAAVDIGQGGAYSVYNYYLVRESGKILRATKTASDVATKAGFVKKATDVLSVSARVIPRPLLWTMRSLGIAGSVIAAIPSSIALYRGITDSSLSSSMRRHMIISGSLGVLASSAFAVGAFFITPAGLTIGTIAILAGLTLIGIQTIYDEWPSIKRTFRKGWDACRDFVNNAPSGFVNAIKTFPVPTQIKSAASKVVNTCVKIAKKFVSGCASVAKTLGSGCKRAWNYVFG